MKNLLLVVAVVTLCGSSPAFARGRGGGSHRSSSSGGSHTGHTSVKSYTKKDGTHVESHHRSAADGTKNNNWSTKGNVNPDTGKAGTKSPE